MQETRVQTLSREDRLEKEMATHSSTLAWRVPWGRNLVGYSPWDHKELDTTESWTQLSDFTHSLTHSLIRKMHYSLSWKRKLSKVGNKHSSFKKKEGSAETVGTYTTEARG